MREIGRGGFSVVYEARDVKLNRPCAIKVMSSATSAEQKRIEDEAHILSHYSTRFGFIPNIYDTWNDNLQTYMVMEYIDGQTLEDTLMHPWPSPQVEEFLRTLLAHLSHLHTSGIIHRDLKPANIIRTTYGSYWLLDFGIAKQGASTRTMVRQMGSPMYTPLEQFLGQPATPQSDLYSLAATAYHLLTGQAPTSADARKLGASLRPPHKLVAGVSPVLEKTLLAMLALEPASRPLNAQEALKVLTAQPSVSTQPTSPPKQRTTVILSALQNRTTIIAALIAGLFAVIVACVGITGSLLSNIPSGSVIQPTAANVPESPLQSSGKLAPDFTLRDSQGNNVNLTSELESGSVVLVIYFGHT